ncbi:MAG: hypothetical protein KA717_34640 [Woronichinia naegeliana WA131]|jgi:hypothetical protein|uniref:Uncharacterized protein n=1 Tax=Woronichinia naegeliana WA131 TaxID=2824559 RepID=A0A977KY88_9CYAN|nr:MAG: hypothetical protein KA717_34640 [Woronichinia naegeliana WA131]
MSQTLEQLKTSLLALPVSQQQWLLEQLGQNIAKLTSERELEIMANDPHIQAEILAINEEFFEVELDGLETL